MNRNCGIGGDREWEREWTRGWGAGREERDRPTAGPEGLGWRGPWAGVSTPTIARQEEAGLFVLKPDLSGSCPPQPDGPRRGWGGWWGASLPEASFPSASQQLSERAGVPGESPRGGTQYHSRWVQPPTFSLPTLPALGSVQPH